VAMKSFDRFKVASAAAHRAFGPAHAVVTTMRGARRQPDTDRPAHGKAASRAVDDPYNMYFSPRQVGDRGRRGAQRWTSATESMRCSTRSTPSCPASTSRFAIDGRLSSSPASFGHAGRSTRGASLATAAEDAEHASRRCRRGRVAPARCGRARPRSAAHKGMRGYPQLTDAGASTSPTCMPTACTSSTVPLHASRLIAPVWRPGLYPSATASASLLPTALAQDHARDWQRRVA